MTRPNWLDVTKNKVCRVFYTLRLYYMQMSAGIYNVPSDMMMLTKNKRNNARLHTCDPSQISTSY